MLEKKENNIHILKLWVVLLLEVDFYAFNKIIFNMRLILLLEYRNIILKEIISSRYNQLAIQLAVNKKLLLDITN